MGWHFLTYGLNPCLLCWQADSLPRSHLGLLNARELRSQTSFLTLYPLPSRSHPFLKLQMSSTYNDSQISSISLHIFSSIQFSRSVMSNCLQPHELQHARPPCPSPVPEAYPNSCPLSWWCHPTISSSASPSPPALNLSQHQGLFKWVSSLYQVANVLEFQLQHQSFHLFPHPNISKLTHFTPSPPQPLWPKTPFSLVLNYYNRLLTGLPASTLTLPQPTCHDSQSDLKKKKKKNQIMSVTCLKHSKNFSLHSEWDLTPYPSLQGHIQAASTCSPDTLPIHGNSAPFHTLFFLKYDLFIHNLRTST